LPPQIDEHDIIFSQRHAELRRSIGADRQALALGLVAHERLKLVHLGEVVEVA
jgi:hypothetical protein